MIDVLAVLHGGGPAAARARTLGAVRTQGAQVLDAAGSTLRSALRQAASDDAAAWLWLVEVGTVPAPDALDVLRAAAGGFARPDPGPVALQSLVVGVDGIPHADAQPRHEIFEKAHTLDAAGRRLVHLRTAVPGSLLVRRDAIARTAPPRGDLGAGTDALEWSARLLRSWDDRGYLVPASIAVREREPLGRAVRRRRRVGRATTLLGAAWSPTERLWEGYLLLGEALGTRTAGADGAEVRRDRDPAAGPVPPAASQSTR